MFHWLGNFSAGLLSCQTTPTNVTLFFLPQKINPVFCSCAFFHFSEDTPIVHYGTDPSVMSVVKGNISKTYTADDMCAAPANSAQFVDPGFIHDVLLTNLELGTRYYYSYGSEKVRVGFLELIYGYFNNLFIKVNPQVTHE